MTAVSATPANPGRSATCIGPLGAHLARERAVPAVRLAGLPVSGHDRFQRLAADSSVHRANRGRDVRTIALRVRSGPRCLLLATSCALATLHFSAGVLPARRGRHPRQPGRATGSPGDSHRCSVRRSCCSRSGWPSVQLYTGVSWITVMDWLGHHVLAAACSWVRGRFAAARDQAAGRESRERPRDRRARGEEEGREAHAAAHRAAGPRGRRAEPSASRRSARCSCSPSRLRATCPSSSCSTSRRRGEHLFARGARRDVAPGRDQAEGLRRRGRGGRGASRAGGHALRAEAGARREGQPDLARWRRTWHARSRRSACASSR